MFKTNTVGARSLTKTVENMGRIKPEMEPRVIKQPDITRNGPQGLSGTA